MNLSICPTASVRTTCAHCVARHTSLCARVDDECLSRLQALARHARFAPGTTVFEQDEEAYRIYIITRGVVRLYRDVESGKRQITGFLGPGDLLGGIRRRTAAHCTAETITEVEVCGFERAAFAALLQAYPDLCFTLLVTAMDEIEAQFDHLVLIGRKQVPERLAAFLLMLSRRWKFASEDPNLVLLPMPRSDIADHLGVTSETISRIFTRFKNEGLIEVPTMKSVIIKNLPRLQALAGFEEIPNQRMAIGL